MYQKLKGIGTKLILSVLIFVSLFNLITPTYSLAGEWYGILVDPISDLVCAIGDAFMNLMQNMLIPGAPVAVTPRQILTVNGKEVDYTQPVMKKVNGENRVVGYKDKDGNTVETSGWPSWLLGGLINNDASWQDKAIPQIYYSPAAIFTNRIPALNINFISPLTQETFEKQYSVILNISADIAGRTPDENFYAEMKKQYGWNKQQAATAWSLAGAMEKIKNNPELWDSYLGGSLIQEIEGENGGITQKSIGNPLANSAIIIAPVVSKWYIALRNLAVTGLLIVLVYVGIRILVASVSEEKAKYKEMIKNWVIAIVLVFVLHYIMLGLITVTEKITDLLDGAVYTTSTAGRSVEQDETKTSEEIADEAWRKDPQDRLFNQVRKSETSAKFDSETSSATMDQFGYSVMYAILVIYTFIFTFKYLKRMVYMVFLTIIAPMVAFTYPIDKIGDSKAQALNIWFREYFFNLILQPVHLLIYTVLVASAIQFAETNMIYAIVAIAFVLEAENIIKKMFGIHAEGGGFVDFAAGAAIAGGLSMIGKGAGNAANAIGNLGNGGNGGNDKDDGKVRQQSVRDPNAKIGLTEAFGGGEEGEDDDTPPTDGEGGTNNAVIAPMSTGVLVSGETPNTGASDGSASDGSAPDGGTPNDEIVEGVTASEATTPEGIVAPTGTTPTISGRTQTMVNPALNISAPVSPNVAINQPSKPKKKIKGVLGGVSNVFGSGVRRVANKNTAIKLAKYATVASVGTVALGTLGTIGLAAGLASNEKLGQYTSIGLGAGAALTGAGANIASKVATRATNAVRTVRDDYQRGALTKDERQAKENEKWRSQYLKDPKVRQQFQDDYGEKAEQMMKYWDEAARYGDPDKDVLKLMDKGMNAQQAMTVVDIAKNDISRKDLVNVNSDARKALDNRIKSIIKDEDTQKQIWEAIHDINHIDSSDRKAIEKGKKEKEQAEEQIQEDEEGRAEFERQKQKFNPDSEKPSVETTDKNKESPTEVNPRRYSEPASGGIPEPWKNPNGEKDEEDEEENE